MTASAAGCSKHLSTESTQPLCGAAASARGLSDAPGDESPVAVPEAGRAVAAKLRGPGLQQPWLSCSEKTQQLFCCQGAEARDARKGSGSSPPRPAQNHGSPKPRTRDPELWPWPPPSPPWSSSPGRRRRNRRLAFSSSTRVTRVPLIVKS